MSVSKHFGPYRLLQPLAKGGMAEIFLARKEGPAGFTKTVVIKRVLPQHVGTRDFVRMFLDEARLAAQLEHPNVVHISDFGEADGAFFLAMEYLRGVDLGTLLKTRLKMGLGPFPPRVAAAVVAQAAAGLHYAHTANDAEGRPLRIVHRDVSPSNLFLTFQGVTKVLDFGIAKAEGKTVETQQGLIKGKLLYMSPEQTWARPLDARSDVWALGVVLYELVTGVRPFFRAAESAPNVLNERRTLEAIDREPPPPPLGVPPGLVAIISRSLQKDLAQRTPSASQLQQELEHFVQEQGGVTSQELVEFTSASLGTDEVARRNVSVAALEPEEVDDADVLPSTASARAATEGPGRPERRSRRGLLFAVAGLLVFGGAATALLSRSATESVETEVVRVTPVPEAPSETPSAPPVVAGPPEVPDAGALVRPTRPTARPRAMGHLTVSCLPFGELYIDAAARGRAQPTLEAEVVAGRHVVRCVHPTLGESRTVVDVVAGGRVVERLEY